MITELHRAGVKHIVMLTGDDKRVAPAIGSAVAVETVDLVPMSDNLLRFPEAIRLSRRTVANMRQNIVIALIP